MKNRRRVPNVRRDKRVFSKTASKVHGKNVRGFCPRGGYRL